MIQCINGEERDRITTNIESHKYYFLCNPTAGQTVLARLLKNWIINLMKNRLLKNMVQFIDKNIRRFEPSV
jgi:predicted alpha/beta-fold hydrolase